MYRDQVKWCRLDGKGHFPGCYGIDEYGTPGTHPVNCQAARCRDARYMIAVYHAFHQAERRERR